MFNFFSKPDPKVEQRNADRALRKVERDIERDRRELEREEKKLEAEIKKLAKEGNNEGCRLLAKQLVQLRKQKNRTYAATSKVKGIGMQNKAMGANVKLANAMGVAGKTMSDMNKTMKTEQIAAMINAFGRESTKMDMTEEIMNDAFDDILADSDEEEESNAVVNQVLDEIGIEIGEKLSVAPTPAKDKVKGPQLTDEDIEAQLSKLRA